MSAVPKKKLCWNCEGNVSREIDNCPYCGVYLHAPEPEEENIWSSSPKISAIQNEEDIPAPIYRASTESKKIPLPEEALSQPLKSVWPQIKTDVLPVLLLMTGSVFFLFSIILLLFSQNGTLTLQWNGDNWLYFLVASLPSLYLGWRYLQQVKMDE